jgi:hypothetical protein
VEICFCMSLIMTNSVDISSIGVTDTDSLRKASYSLREFDVVPCSLGSFNGNLSSP